MKKVLNRTLFSAPKQDHRGTGITSGLKYRQNYKTGGRVNFQNGGINPNVQFGDTRLKSVIDSFKEPFVAGSDLIFGPANLLGRALFDYTPGYSGRRLFNYGPEEEQNKIGFAGFDIDATQGYGDRTLRKAREREKVEEEIERQKRRDEYNFVSGRVPDAITDPNQRPKKDPNYKKDKKEDILQNNAIDTFFKLKESSDDRRKDLDLELAKLREEQDRTGKVNSIIKGLVAANDPNLRKGQSRVATGVGAFADATTDERTKRVDRKADDLSTKYSRLESDITRENNLEDYKTKKIYDQEFGAKGARVEYLDKLLNLLDFQDDGKKKQFIRELTTGKKGGLQSITSDILAQAGDQMTDPNEFRTLYGISSKETEDGQSAPLTSADVEAAIKYIDNIINRQSSLSFDNTEFADGGRINRSNYAVGGRVGYAEGNVIQDAVNEVTSKEVPIVMGYDQLRKKLPSFVDDQVISLISYSPNAFKDFAIIETETDVEEFNEKYDTQLQLPTAGQDIDVNVGSNNMETMAPVNTPTAIPAPATPPVAPAQPVLTPTETALLSPTEQAIRMRNMG